MNYRAISLLRFVLILCILGVPWLSQAGNLHGGGSQQGEMQAWFGDGAQPAVISGCEPAVPGASLTLAAFACKAYVRGATADLVYVTQIASAVGPLNTGNDAYWIAVHRDTTTSVGGWTRQAGTHYLWQRSATPPSEPTAGLIIAKVTVAAGAITQVERRGARSMYPLSTTGQLINVLDYGAKGDDTAIENEAFRLAFAAAASGSVVWVPRGASGTYKLTALVVVATDKTTLRCAPGVTLHWTALGTSTSYSGNASTAALRINANDFTIEGCVIKGPHSAATYVAEANGLEMVGTSTSVRKTGLTIRQTEWLHFGSRALMTQFVDQIRVKDTWIHDIRYAAAQFFSSNHGYFSNNRIKTITPGTGGAMYGFACTHDSTDYDLDANAGTKSATHPFCWNWHVDHNTVEDINWECLSFHAGYDNFIENNKLYGCLGGIAVPTSSGDAINYAGSDNIVANNHIDVNYEDGSASGRANQTSGFCINVNGGSATQSTRVQVSENTCIGYGAVSNADAGSILASTTNGALLRGNRIESWGSNGLLFKDVRQLITVSDNQCSSLANGADTVANCLSTSNVVSTAEHLVSTNSIIAGSGTAARVGFNFSALTTRPTLTGNQFYLATVAAFNPPSNGFAKGPDLANILTSTDAATPSVAACTVGVRCVLKVTPTAPLTITNLTNGTEGLIVTIVAMNANAITVDRSNAALLGSANWVSSAANQSVTLMRLGSLWVELSRCATCG